MLSRVKQDNGFSARSRLFMKALLQRVRTASVEVDGEIVSSIDKGLLVFLGVGKGDTDEDGKKLAAKVVDLRIFPDENHSMNRSLQDSGGEVLLVSQFTLQADCRRGRRPSFTEAEDPVRAEEMYKAFGGHLRSSGVSTREGVFGAHMNVRLDNDGPVTIMLASAYLSRGGGGR